MTINQTEPNDGPRFSLWKENEDKLRKVSQETRVSMHWVLNMYLRSISAMKLTMIVTSAIREEEAADIEKSKHRRIRKHRSSSNFATDW